MLFFVFSGGAFAQDAGKDLLGPINVEDLLMLPGWFAEDYIRYRPVPVYVDEIPQYIDDVQIVCVLGTWCSDSKREVPRMIRILQTNNIDPAKMTMIGVDKERRSPGNEAEKYNIEKVPTFIFLKNGEEMGRIVETPIGSLEKDMLGIIQGNWPPEEPEVIQDVLVGSDGSAGDIPRKGDIGPDGNPKMDTAPSRK